ncbi:hypothetical protein [Endozoicomonas sp. SESOKO1]|uniref:hypothetical protein n=1 Tax=Endozoicomonas sp. SESOKO1 TaxID=2828742 RepID=UPI0021472445|nr:hypothetical protein [Endozoicomonas sp. SESOKO1]
MESFILIVAGIFALYYLSQKQDNMADKMLGHEFNRFERIYHNITYSCQNATIVRKQLTSGMPLPFIPSTTYSVKALCLTEDKHWFWFDASIRHMKMDRTSITPTNAKEAFNALKDDPEILHRYFSNHDQQSA